MSDFDTTKPARLRSVERQGPPICGSSSAPETELVPLKPGLMPWPSDVQRLIQRWQEGRSPHTVRAYGRDLAHFA
ncbi:MAG: hypothetical protein WAO08_30820 [Hyphomicrobiaceae bacterium]